MGCAQNRQPAGRIFFVAVLLPTIRQAVLRGCICHIHKCVYIHIYIYIHTYVHTYTHTHTCINVCIYIYIHTYEHVYV